jgi:MinD-like ATPase involved in chromosome partitioning or flagellar assembly
MRIVVGGVKGGVGKSLISASVSKLLARMGFNVLLIDREVLGWSSELLGLRTKGLVHNVMTGEGRDHYTEFREGGVLGVLRFYGDSPTFYRSLRLWKEEEFRRKVFEEYRGLLKGKEFHFFVVDNPPNVFYSSEVVGFEASIFYRVLGEMQRLLLCVSDPTERGVTEAVKYTYAVLEDLASIPVRPPGVFLGFVVNMVPPLPDEMVMAERRAKEACEKLKASVCGVIPFDERLYAYSDLNRVEDFPDQMRQIVQQISQLALSLTSWKAKSLNT